MPWFVAISPSPKLTRRLIGRVIQRLLVTGLKVIGRMKIKSRIWIVIKRTARVLAGLLTVIRSKRVRIVIVVRTVWLPIGGSIGSGRAGGIIIVTQIVLRRRVLVSKLILRERRIAAIILSRIDHTVLDGWDNGGDNMRSGGGT